MNNPNEHKRAEAWKAINGHLQEALRLAESLITIGGARDHAGYLAKIRAAISKVHDRPGIPQSTERWFNEGSTVYDENRLQVAHVVCKDEDYSDARLIAASPEMLEALQIAEAELEDSTAPATADHVLPAVRAAIDAAIECDELPQSTDAAEGQIRSPKRKPVCPECGSDNVAADAAARWDIETQTWEVTNVFDKGHGCDNCEAGDIEFEWMKCE